MPGLPTQAALLLLYGYIPNQGAADVAVICYVPISVAVTAVTVKTKAWYMLLVTVAAVFELAGEPLLLSMHGGAWPDLNM